MLENIIFKTPLLLCNKFSIETKLKIS